MPTLAPPRPRRPTRWRTSAKVFLALLGALLLNVLLLFLAVLASAHWPRHRPRGLPGPLQVEIVPDTAPTPEPSGPADAGATPLPYIRTTDDMSKATPPDKPAFQSSANTEAAAELPASGDKPLPSQAGRELPSFDFDTRPYRLGKEAVDAAASAPAAPAEQAHPPSDEKPPETRQPPKTAKTRKTQGSAPTPTPAPSGDLVMMMPNSTPSPEPPAPQATVEPGEGGVPPPPRPKNSQSRPNQPPAAPANASSAGVPRPPGYQPQSIQTKMAGSINNRGKAAPAAIGTPLGRYDKAIHDAIGMLWYYHTEERAGDIGVDSVKIQFEVDRGGRVRNVRFTGGNPNRTLGLISEQSIKEAAIPPMPTDVATTSGGQLEEEITFSFYTF